MALLPPLPARSIAIDNAKRAVLALAIIVALDQFTKWLVVESMNLKEIGSIDFIPFLNFRMAQRWPGRPDVVPHGNGPLAADRHRHDRNRPHRSAMWSRRPLARWALATQAAPSATLADRFTYGAVARASSTFGIRHPQSVVVQRRRHRDLCGFGSLFWPSKARAPTGALAPL
jgi:hypothetical protein